ncbi:3' 5'-cyclic adenosine monophosphate phosphodiesterase CpdA [termite gut metagenome]|uniref:3' 5'-cyclic adenosine monophosphate phosphodiesterase CpdA n=1 Tax=termite gut metagenome TaxID=433724 RepID=A0A5J4RI82_9ZZZZ
MNMIRFLQFSDIHFLFCEDTEDEYAQMRIRFIEDLENVKKQLGVVDYVLICGDIACKGQKNEFNKAKIFIESVSKALEVDGNRPNIFLVPGNHDIDRQSYKATRDLLRPSLLDKKNDEFLQAIKHTEPDTLKILYAPLLAYNEFAQPYSIDEVSETIMIGDIDEHYFDGKNYYWKFCLGKESNYTVNLYGLNSTLTCDGKEAAKKDLKEGNHLTFLPKPAYNIQTYSNEINISMMHHPLDWLKDENHACTIFDDRFKLQFFGHMHVQNSQSNKAVKIFSGAFQPEKEADIKDCPPVFNVIKLDVEGAVMIVELESRKWDGAYFIKYKEESKTMSVSLAAPNNWSETTQEEAKKEPIVIEHIMKPIHEINYMFINSDRQREIIERLVPGTFDDERSERANCLLFLKAVKERGLYQQLLNELNK